MSPALAVSPAEQRGKTYALTNCARCHSIDRVTQSPLKIAPPFRTLHLRYPVETLGEALAEGIETGHPTMPAFQLDPDQIHDLLSYLKSLPNSAPRLPSKITIIQGHPDPRAVIFVMHWPTPMPTLRLRPVTKSAALRSRASNSRCCEQRKNSIRVRHRPLKPAADAIVAADHIVLVFPLWLGTVPALAEAFLEQVIRPGVVFSYEKYGAKKLLAGCSAHIVVTLGMPAWLYRTFYCGHGLRGLRRNVFRFVGFSAGPNHDVPHGRERVRRDEIPLVSHYAQQWRDSALTP